MHGQIEWRVQSGCDDLTQHNLAPTIMVLMMMMLVIAVMIMVVVVMMTMIMLMIVVMIVVMMVLTSTCWHPPFPPWVTEVA